MQTGRSRDYEETILSDSIDFASLKRLLTRNGHSIMNSIRCGVAVACRLLVNAPSSQAPDCRHKTTGDICAAGSSWGDFTQFRVRMRGEDLAALRKYIADQPVRGAKRRVPADPANPGRPQTFSFEAFEIDGKGTTTLVGKKVLEYRPGIDVMVEEMPPLASSKR